VDAFDLACSRFRPDSELSLLIGAGGAPRRVGPVLLEATLAALRAASLTDGLVDPTVGGSLLALGYDRDFEEVRASSSSRPTVSLVPVPGWRTVEVDTVASTIRVPKGVVLDLGATAKALAADRAAKAAQAAAGCGVLVGFGGDIALAGEAPGGGWRVRVTDDHRGGEQAPGQWISLHSGGLATSSTTVRSWRSGSRAVHHLIDPGSGAPVDSIWRTVSVAAATCLDANIASTAAVLLSQQAAEWLSSLRLPGRLIGVDGRVHHLAGWPAVGDELPVRAELSAGAELVTA
jgi:thiamine biosynthesis lipoprotein